MRKKNALFFLTSISLLIYCLVFKIYILILDTVIGEIVSQIFYLGPRFDFMKFRI